MPGLPYPAGMQDERLTAEGTTRAFRKQIGIAAARYRLERLARVSRSVAWSLAVALLALLLLALFTPVIVVASVLALGFFVVALFSAIIVYLQAIDRRRLLVRMDAHGKLPDFALSAGDWETSGASNPWREHHREETVRALEKVGWKTAWPVRWPRLLWVPLLSAVLLAFVIAFVQKNSAEKTRLAQLAAAQESAPVSKEQLKPLEQIFQDWDDAQKIAPSPELAELLKQLKPMRDQMASGQMTEKELFLKMNEVQARLQAAKEKLEAGSLEPMAQSLADAVKDLDGMSGLSAAMERKDFATAREQAALAEKKYNAGAAKMPEDATAQKAAGKLGEAAQKASSDQQASFALKQMQNSLGKKDGSGMGKGLGDLKNSLGQQAQREGQGKNLGLQLSQLGQARDGMGKQGGSSGIKAGLPQLSLAKSLQPGKGAGSAIDPNRLGAQTRIDASHQDMKLTGTAGEGASETQTESTKDPHFEQTASSVNAEQYKAYEKMSEEATQDENLPVADRQMIKRYFEDIRPRGGP